MRYIVDKSVRNCSGIYKITNQVNGKLYIGSATNLFGRARQHKSKLLSGKHPNKHLLNSIAKHGIDCLLLEVIETCSLDVLYEREQFWMNHYDVINTGYNISPKAGGMFGYKRSEEHNKKYVASRRASGWFVSAETRELRSVALKGRVFSPETIERMKIAAKKRWENPVSKNKMIQSKTGQSLTEIHKQRISEGLYRFNKLSKT